MVVRESPGVKVSVETVVDGETEVVSVETKVDAVDTTESHVTITMPLGTGMSSLVDTVDLLKMEEKGLLLRGVHTVGHVEEVMEASVVVAVVVSVMEILRRGVNVLVESLIGAAELAVGTQMSSNVKVLGVRTGEHQQMS